MDHLTANTFYRAESWLCITTLFYFLLNGAQLFETCVIVPKWTASPPESLHYFKGKYGLDLKTFWVIAHSLHEITFILAILFCWQSDVRNILLVLFAIHLAVRTWTILYFAPRIMAFQELANAESFMPNLRHKVTRWRNLNYLRVGLFLAVSIGMVLLCADVLNFKW